MPHRLSVSSAKVKPALLKPYEYLRFVVVLYQTGLIAGCKYILDCKSKGLLTYIYIMLWLTSKLSTLTCCHCVSVALTQAQNSPTRPFNLFRPPFGHRLPEFDVFKSVHVYKDDPIKLPQRATSAAKSNCARRGAAIQFTQPSKLLQQNLCRIAPFHMHKKTYVRSLLHMSPDKPQSVMALF